MTTRQAGYGIQPNSALEGPVRPKAEKKRASHFTEALSSGPPGVRSRTVHALPKDQLSSQSRDGSLGLRSVRRVLRARRKLSEGSPAASNARRASRADLTFEANWPSRTCSTSNTGPGGGIVAAVASLTDKAPAPRSLWNQQDATVK